MKYPVGLLLRAVAGAVQVPEVFGPKAGKLAPVLTTLASFADLPEKLEPERAALLEQVQRWVDEKREPTDEELDAFRARRDELDALIRAEREKLGDGQ